MLIGLLGRAHGNKAPTLQTHPSVCTGAHALTHRWPLEDRLMRAAGFRGARRGGMGEGETNKEPALPRSLQ